MTRRLNPSPRRPRPNVPRLALGVAGFLGTVAAFLSPALPAAPPAAGAVPKAAPYNPFTMPPPPHLDLASYDAGALEAGRFPHGHALHACGTAVWTPRTRDLTAEALLRRGTPTPFSETEANNVPATANLVPLGFDGGESDAVLISGTVGAAATGGSSSFTTAENNDSIGTATDSGHVGGTNQTRTTQTTIGDGAFGRDVDFFAIAANAGQSLFINVAVQSPRTLGDSYLGLYDAAGNLLASDDDSGAGFGSALSFIIPADGTYYAAIAGWLTFGDAANLPSDPFTPGTMPAGSTSTGTYDLTLTLSTPDLDFFALELEAGDILGVSLTGTPSGSILLAPDGTTSVMGSGQDATFIYPTASPLPGSGSTRNFGFVTPATGTYYLFPTTQPGAYQIEARLFRPDFHAQPELNHQYLFLDFDGVTGLNASALFGSGGSSVTLSPISSFLAGWSLSGQEAALIDAISARVQAIMDDVATNANNGSLPLSGNPGDFKITVLNSKDHPDVWGLPNVSRIIIGGTISQLGISTIGIAESIDVGNFETEETAVVLLDLLSASSANPNSLNQYSLGGGATKIDLVATGVGNITAHEAAHFFGCWHTDQFNGTACIIDQGGNLSNSVGVGADDIFGTGDDVDVLLVVDTLNSSEGFVGNQDAKNAVAFGLSTGREPGIFRDLLTDDVTYTGLRAGDDTITIAATGTAGEVNLTSAFGGPQPMANVTSFTALLHGGDDTVSATASPSVPITVDGGGQTSADALTFDDEGLAITPPSPAPPAGVITSGSREPFTYMGFETLNVVPVELSGFVLD